MNVADTIARSLAAAGVSRVYGYPGEDHMLLLAAIEAAGLTYVLAASETSACIMAAAEAEVSGRPGIAIVSFAPGLTNAINGIASARLDRVPLLIFAGQHPAARRASIVRQNLDNHELVRGVVKASVTLDRGAEAGLLAALDVAQSQPRGPVFVEIPEEVAAAEAEPPARTPMRPFWAEAGIAEPPAARAADRAPAGDLQAVRDLIATARRPVLLVGAPDDAGAGPFLIGLAATHRMVAFTTPSAKGILDPLDPWLAGTFLHGNLEDAILERADLILAVDLSARDFLNREWTYECPVAWIGERPYAERYLPIAAEVHGPLGAIAAALHDEATGASTWTTADVLEHRARVRTSLEVDAPGLHVPGGLAVLGAVAPPGLRVAVDAGFAKPLTSLLWEPARAGAYLSSHGLSTMGYALPAAIGMRLATDDPVVALMGDGSFLMRLGDVVTAASLGLPVVVIVWVDGLLAQINIKQERRGLARVGTALPSLLVGPIAASLGAAGADVETPAELEAELRAAFGRRGPTVIGAHVTRARHRELYEVIRG